MKVEHCLEAETTDRWKRIGGVDINFERGEIVVRHPYNTNKKECKPKRQNRFAVNSDEKTKDRKYKFISKCRGRNKKEKSDS